MKLNQLKLLTCPKCHKSLTKNKNILRCRFCHGILKILNGIVLSDSYIPEDLLLSVKKWDELYRLELESKEYEQKANDYHQMYQNDTYNQLNEIRPLKGSTYLEIGCGEFFLGRAIANKCKIIIGIDLSRRALIIAKKMLDKKRIKNYLLIQADIRQMPLKSNCVDIIYGGGVIEHFKDTKSCISELFRVLNNNGVSFNTVPFLNIGSLTYRQLWGNIPNFFIMKQVAEFIHIRLLGAKHMIFGYELSFTRNSLIHIHKQCGFKKCTVDKFKVSLKFDFLPKILRPLFRYIANTFPMFWPMVKVIGYK